MVILRPRASSLAHNILRYTSKHTILARCASQLLLGQTRSAHLKRPNVFRLSACETVARRLLLRVEAICQWHRGCAVTSATARNRKTKWSEQYTGENVQRILGPSQTLAQLHQSLCCFHHLIYSGRNFPSCILGHVSQGQRRGFSLPSRFSYAAIVRRCILRFFLADGGQRSLPLVDR